MAFPTDRNVSSDDTSPKAEQLSGFSLPADFRMPSAEEIERDLALGDQAWMSLLASSDASPEPLAGRLLARRPPARRATGALPAGSRNARALAGAGQPIVEPPTSRSRAVLRAAKA